MVPDTNVVIDYLIGKENIVWEVDSYNKDELSITFVNEYELLKQKNRGILEDAVQNLKIYHSNDLAASAAAKAYRELKSTGRMMSDKNLLIFGVCVANYEILITQDRTFRILRANSSR